MSLYYYTICNQPDSDRLPTTSVSTAIRYTDTVAISKLAGLWHSLDNCSLNLFYDIRPSLITSFSSSWVTCTPFDWPNALPMIARTSITIAIMITRITITIGKLLSILKTAWI